MIFITVFGLAMFFFVSLIKKNWTNAISYITIGITLPLMMYLLQWSALITPTLSKKFVHIFVVFYFILFIYECFTYKLKPNEMKKNDKVVLTKSGKIIVPIINIAFFSFYFLENYLGSGTFVPALKGIDIHTYSASLISFITGVPIITICVNYYSFKATGKLRYILLLLLVFTVPVVTRGSRMAVVSAAICFISIFIFFENGWAKYSIEKMRRFRLIKFILLWLILIVGLYIVYYTTIRMNHYGQYSMKYDDVIKYTGPQWLSFLAPYYGYFPLSFNNLNINLLWRSVHHNYYGLYSFSCWFFGVLHLQTFFNVDQLGDISGGLITSVSATVPTGFWDYYFDYGMLFFIPIIVAFFLCWIFLNNARKEKYTLNKRTVYFWYVSLWFLMSFQNTMFSSVVIVSGLILNYSIKYSFKVVQR